MPIKIMSFYVDVEDGDAEFELVERVATALDDIGIDSASLAIVNAFDVTEPHDPAVRY